MVCKHRARAHETRSHFFVLIRQENQPDLNHPECLPTTVIHTLGVYTFFSGVLRAIFLVFIYPIMECKHRARARGTRSHFCFIIRQENVSRLNHPQCLPTSVIRALCIYFFVLFLRRSTPTLFPAFIGRILRRS